MRLALACTLLATVVALTPARPALAQDATLTLTMQHTAKGKTTQIDGVEATIYRVASLDDNVNHYTLLDDFASLGVEFDEGVDAAQMEELAQAAAQIVQDKQLEGTSVTSDQNGTAAFGALDQGVYLVMQTGSTGTAKDYESFETFLISVPQLTEEGIVWDVTCLPKFRPIGDGGRQPHRPGDNDDETPDKPTPRTPVRRATPLSKTGDDTNPLVWTCCFAVGLALVATGSWARRRVRAAAER